MIDRKTLAKFVEIMNMGGTVVCTAATRRRIMACVDELGGEAREAWSAVPFRITPHMPDGRIAAFTHDATSAPTDLTDAS